ncbi:MAG: phosphohistidine phosphatase SixA [Acidobacteriota bacterium]
MRVYLVQHGKSKSKEEDPSRSLTQEGIGESTRIGEFLAQIGLSVSAIRHSGKTRAEQTASLLGRGIGEGIGIEQSEGLAPLDDPQVMTESLNRICEDVMLVGHLPHLERLASTLLTGKPGHNPVQFKNSGVVCLERSEGKWWSLVWAITPELL